MNLEKKINFAKFVIQVLTFSSPGNIKNNVESKCFVFKGDIIMWQNQFNSRFISKHMEFYHENYVN